MSCVEVDFARPHRFRAGDRVLLCFDLTPWLGGQATAVQTLVGVQQSGGDQLTIEDAAIVQSPGFRERDSSRIVGSGKGVQVWYECETTGTYLVYLSVVLDNSEEITLWQRVVVGT